MSHYWGRSVRYNKQKIIHSYIKSKEAINKSRKNKIPRFHSKDVTEDQIDLMKELLSGFPIDWQL